MSKMYDALHLRDYSDQELGKAKTESERVESNIKKILLLYLLHNIPLVNVKRIAGGWMTYSLIEIKQRYRIPG